jgi:hypothetical protein
VTIGHTHERDTMHAHAYYERALTIRRRIFGDAHPAVARLLPLTLAE